MNTSSRRSGTGTRASAAAFLLLAGVSAPAQQAHPDSHYAAIARRLVETGLGGQGAYALLQELTAAAPHRLSGSPGAARAVELTRRMMEQQGFANVRLEAVSVPVWVRGEVERAAVVDPQGGAEIPLSVCALGGTVATPPGGITAEVIEVRTLDEIRALGNRAEGRIIFLNRPFDRSLMDPFDGYGGAVDQRWGGAIETAVAGGAAVLVRSLTPVIDDVPHTGSVGTREGVRPIHAAAISTAGADRLSALLRERGAVTVRLTLDCSTLPDAESANVLGEITGWERPGEIIVVSGHLDCWDKGSGAHDDGAGCVQAIEAVHLLRRIGVRPRRTIRAVMYMNEENGLRGGRAYAAAPGRSDERHIAALESDAGGFAPRGFGVQADSAVVARVQRWAPLFAPLLADRIEAGYGGVDISPLVRTGVPGIGLNVEKHRYFDYHHSDHDTIDKVHPRELEMGAVVEALLCYLISEEGL